MSDNEQTEHVIDVPEEEPAPAVAAKPKRKLTEKQIENLRKAREVKRMNTLTKRPVEKRARATELYEKDIDKRAEKKAQELAAKILEEKERERELQELRGMKKELEKAGKGTKGKEVKVKASKNSGAAAAKPKPRKSAGPSRRKTQEDGPSSYSNEGPEMTYVQTGAFVFDADRYLS